MSGVAAAVRTSGLTKVYGEGEAAVQALRGVDLRIPSGEFVVLLGPSGSGKTTLLNQIGALEPPTSGEVEVDGVRLADLDEHGRTRYRLGTVGFIFQFYNLVPTLTARENVALIAEITGEGDPAARTEDVLSKVGLADRADHFPGQLSGGEQQRVSIARGLVKDPPLLLCDEPTGALDVDSGAQILRLLARQADAGRTVFTVTHNANIARTADRVLELRDGRIVDERAQDRRAAPTPGQP